MRDYDAATWKSAFRAELPPHLVERQVTLLCTELPDADWTFDDMEELASRFGGRCEPCAQGKALLVFDVHGTAIRAALLVQQLATGRSTRSCLASGRAHEARFDAQGRTLHVLAGPLVDAALHGLFAAVPGAISLEPRSYASLELAVAEHAANAVLMTEWDDETVCAATLTPAPSTRGAGSTFAGLGRV